MQRLYAVITVFLFSAAVCYADDPHDSSNNIRNSLPLLTEELNAFESIMSGQLTEAPKKTVVFQEVPRRPISDFDKPPHQNPWIVVAAIGGFIATILVLGMLYGGS